MAVKLNDSLAYLASLCYGFWGRKQARKVPTRSFSKIMLKVNSLESLQEEVRRDYWTNMQMLLRIWIGIWVMRPRVMSMCSLSDSGGLVGSDLIYCW
jgi:hypothetical protein